MLPAGLLPLVGGGAENRSLCAGALTRGNAAHLLIIRYARRRLPIGSAAVTEPPRPMTTRLPLTSMTV